ncbi:hypothetical protein [Protaetiibacter larvae]|uniref:YggT family protein n=1 Tax=Protaetiibacter larvae TaxID=2592654 RepID=A0A5C1Y8N3_9MICO|nr:hypothetical protein [Protaetiibacter larvae]QEO10010.1 hypothetical protein FLP23_08335 [Protaetiibacter larvae]
MITQYLLDFVSVMVGGLVSLIPPLPSGSTEMMSGLTDGIARFMETAAYLAPIVPYEVFPTITTYWLALVGVWGAYLVLRFVLWAANR